MSSGSTVKWVVGGTVILGFLYLIYKLIDKTEIHISLPAEAKDIAATPEVSPTSYEAIDFHPAIHVRTETAFKTGDFSGAVRHAAIAFYDLVRHKSGIDSDGIKLIQTVFRGDSPVLVFKPSQEPHVEKSNVGIIDAMEAFTKAVRNKHMHAETQISEKEALLEINMACYLAHHVENNTVLTIENEVRA